MHTFTSDYTWFKNGHLLFDNKPHPGWPSTLQRNGNIMKIREKILEDRHRTSDKVVEMTSDVFLTTEAIEGIIS